VASASLFKAFLEGSKREVRVVFSHPVGLYQDLREYTEDSDCVVIADIALDELRVADVVPLLGELAGRASVTYVDHHPPFLGRWWFIAFRSHRFRGSPPPTSQRLYPLDHSTGVVHP
jgi:hypothetical protein